MQTKVEEYFQKFQKLKMTPKTPKNQKFKKFKKTCNEASNKKVQKRNYS